MCVSAAASAVVQIMHNIRGRMIVLEQGTFVLFSLTNTQTQSGFPMPTHLKTCQQTHRWGNVATDNPANVLQRPLQ